MKKIFTITALLLILAGESQAQFTYTYTGKPRFQILTRRAAIDTLGIINVELFPTIAPRATRNFDSLVSTNFYDSTAFHRVVPGFVIQGGDPNSRSGPVNTWGYGDPGQPTVMAEFSPAKHVRGILSAARSNNINSATSQFFICVATASNLNGQYSIYGRVTSGMTVVDTIVSSPRNASDRPLQKIDMFIKYIGSNDTIPNAPNLTFPPNDSSAIDATMPLFVKWSRVPDAILYNVEVAADSLFTDSVAFVISSNQQLLLNTLQPYSTYYWRVKTNNGGNYSAYSPVYKFYTTWDLTSLPSYALNQQPGVFPNPGSGKFNFTGFEKGNRLQILDVNGKLIYETTLKDNATSIDLEGRDKGVYLYRVTDAQKKEVRQGKLS